MLVRAKSDKNLEREMALSETVLIPAAVGPYEVINRGRGTCKVVKTFLRA